MSIPFKLALQISLKKYKKPSPSNLVTCTMHGLGISFSLTPWHSHLGLPHLIFNMQVMMNRWSTIIYIRRVVFYYFIQNMAPPQITDLLLAQMCPKYMMGPYSIIMIEIPRHCGLRESGCPLSASNPFPFPYIHRANPWDEFSRVFKSRAIFKNIL